MQGSTQLNQFSFAKRCSFVLSALTLIALQVRTAQAAECMPGWSDKLAQLRAAQRAHACSKALSFTDCEGMMGLGVGAAAVGAVAAGKGASAVKGAVDRVRDASFRPCPVSFGARQNYPRYLELQLLQQFFGDEAWAACSSPMDIRKAQVLESLRLVEEEVDRRLKDSEELMSRMNSQHRELAELPESQRVARAKALAQTNTAELSKQFTTTKKAYETARDNMGYGSWFDQHVENQRLKESRHFELRKLFQQYFGQAMGDELWDFNALSERLSGPQKEKFDRVRRELKEAAHKEFEAKFAMDKIERDPSVKKLKDVAGALDTQAIKMRQLGLNGASYFAELEKEREEYGKALKEAQKVKQTLADMRAATHSAVTPADLYQVASRVRSMVPAGALVEGAKTALGAAVNQVAALADTLSSFDRKLSDVGSAALSRFLPGVSGASPAMRAVGLAAGRVAGFVGGGLFAGVTFAANEGASRCQAMPTSELFPATEENNCDRFSLDNEHVRKMAEMDSDALCRLAKDNSEIIAMINDNYAKHYGTVRGQCGDPLRLASSLWGNLTFDRKVLQFTPAGESRPVRIEFDQSGNEAAIRYPAAARANMTKAVEWGKSAPWGFGDLETKSLSIYRSQILPALAEAKACCSSDAGVKPDSSDCARMGLTSTPAGTGGRGRTTR